MLNVFLDCVDRHGRGADMNLIRINERTLLNGDAIAWIDFESHEDGRKLAVVHFLLSDRTGDLVKQVFEGTGASVLKELVPHRDGTEESDERAITTVAFQPFRKKKAWYFSRGMDRPVF